MATRAVRIDLPVELIALLGSAEATAAKAKESLVAELLREARISQGRASEILGVTRSDVLNLMTRYEISSGAESTEELDREVEYLRKLPRRNAGG